MKTATKRASARAVPRPAPSPLPTLADYGLKPRGELPGESWVNCRLQERAYTAGFDWGRCGGGVHGCPFLRSDHRRGFWLLGMNDGARVRERRGGK